MDVTRTALQTGGSESLCLVQQRMIGEDAEAADTVWGYFLRVKNLQNVNVLMRNGLIEKEESTCRREDRAALILRLKMELKAQPCDCEWFTLSLHEDGVK